MFDYMWPTWSPPWSCQDPMSQISFMQNFLSPAITRLEHLSACMRTAFLWAGSNHHYRICYVAVPSRHIRLSCPIFWGLPVLALVLTASATSTRDISLINVLSCCYVPCLLSRGGHGIVSSPTLWPRWEPWIPTGRVELRILCLTLMLQAICYRLVLRGATQQSHSPICYSSFLLRSRAQRTTPSPLKPTAGFQPPPPPPPWWRSEKELWESNLPYLLRPSYRSVTQYWQTLSAGRVLLNPNHSWRHKQQQQ